MLYTTNCIICGKQYSFEVSDEGYKRWLEGEHIQYALPTLTPDQREIMISGICGKCFDKMFEGE
ncbi:MAG: hypothetical protein GX664_04025 [Bacteroidales bacterium]|nr:hypothetical protein [Bacteroidales bacterium]